MKNTDISKIRQLLEKVISRLCEDCSSDGCATQEGCQYKDLFHEINQALALLPCETCGGSGRLAKYNQVGDLVVGEPCPDCQPKLCVCCEEITKENAHLHRNCGK